MTMQIITASYDGVPVEFDYAGWFNATKAAAKFGKKPYEWLRLPETLRYIDALCRNFKAGKSRFVRTARGGVAAMRGTWLHPKLAVRFAQWLDIDFAVWCDEIIENILQGFGGTMQKPPEALSTTADREPLGVNVWRLICQQRLSADVAWRAANDYAGVKRARKMRCGEVQATAEFTGRLLSHAATPADFKRMEANGVAIRGESIQLGLFPAEGDDE